MSGRTSGTVEHWRKNSKTLDRPLETTVIAPISVTFALNPVFAAYRRCSFLSTI